MSSINDDEAAAVAAQQEQQQLAQVFAAQAMAFDQQQPGAAAALLAAQNPMIAQFWANQIQQIEEGSFDFKTHQLPLARIKKVMKTDDDVRSKMISAEVPILFAKACEIFVLELTMRAWIHTEQNKRRTLQKSDIAAAISKTDTFDFLIDIVPRDAKKIEDMRNFMAPEFQQYYQSMVASQFPNVCGFPLEKPAASATDPNMLAYQQQMQMQQYRMGLGDPNGGRPEDQSEHHLQQQEQEE